MKLQSYSLNYSHKIELTYHSVKGRKGNVKKKQFTAYMHVKMYFSLHILVKSSFFFNIFCYQKNYWIFNEKIQFFIRDLKKPFYIWF